MSLSRIPYRPRKHRHKPRRPLSKHRRHPPKQILLGPYPLDDLTDQQFLNHLNEILPPRLEPPNQER